MVMPVAAALRRADARFAFVIRKLPVPLPPPTEPALPGGGPFPVASKVLITARRRGREYGGPPRAGTGPVANNQLAVGLIPAGRPTTLNSSAGSLAKRPATRLMSASVTAATSLLRTSI